MRGEGRVREVHHVEPEALMTARSADEPASYDLAKTVLPGAPSQDDDVNGGLEHENPPATPEMGGELISA
jgi:hypothetical protein